MHRSHTNLLPLPVPDYNDPKEIYAFFGLAIYYAQLLEHSLLCLAVLLCFTGRGLLTQKECDSIGAMRTRRALGQLLKAMGHVVEVPKRIEERLSNLLGQRYYLTYQFSRYTLKIRGLKQAKET